MIKIQMTEKYLDINQNINNNKNIVFKENK